MGVMVMGMREGIEIVKEEEDEEEGLMSRVNRLGREEWRIVGVYVNEDLEKKWEKLRAWAEGSSERIRTIVGGDFNMKTGRMGGWWEGRDGREEGEGKRSKDDKVNREDK
ncbi:hypothetical protein P5V15_011367 [Pogonomyrmex californicus]